MIDAQYLRFIAGSKFSKDRLRNTLIDAADAMDAQAAAIARLREALQSIVDCCDEDHAARDYSSRQTEIRGIARYALALAQGEKHDSQN